MFRFLRIAAASAAAGAVSYTAALAMPVSADFRGEFDLPSFSTGARVLESLGEPVAGAPDLDLADEIANPDTFRGFASVDLDVSGLVTLIGDQSEAGFADYELAVITISNIVFGGGETITGFSQVSSGVLDPDPSFVQVMPTLSFTANSVSIVYDTGGSTLFQFLDGGVSTFQIETAVADVPLPAGGVLLLSAFGALAALRRKAARG